MKKFIAISLVAVMAGTLLAGCGSSESSETDGLDELNSEANQQIILNEIEFEVPDTWIQDDESDGISLTSNDTVLTADWTDEIYDISKEANQDAFIDLYASTDDSFTETGRELITILDDTPALYFSSKRNVSGYDMEVDELVFSTSDSFYLFLYGVNPDAENDHSNEFDEIIDSITWAPGYTGTEVEGKDVEEEEVEEEEVASVPEDDFFGDEQRQEQYDELYTSYQLSALYDYVNEYIADTGDEISPDDSAYKILDLIEPLLDYEDTWVVTQDEFDSSYIVTFPGADEISESESIKVYVSGSELSQTVGFMKDDWLFFDKFALSINGEEVDSHSNIKSYDKTEEVISGGTIEEAYSGSHLFDDDICDQVKDAETVIIRFENTSEDNTYDHTLTDAEKDALYVSNLLRNNWTDLSNLIYRYRNNIVIDEE